MSNHKLAGGTLTRDEDGITARCECGWVSGGHFTRLGASAMFQEHVEKADEAAKQAFLNGRFIGTD